MRIYKHRPSTSGVDSPGNFRDVAVKLLQDDRGMVWTTELMLGITIMVLGGIVGLATFRDAVVQEFGDMAAATATLDHSYEFSGHANTGTIGTVDFDYSVAGSTYQDLANFCEPADVDPANEAPMCIVIDDVAPIDEGESL